MRIQVDESKRAKQRGISDSDVWSIELSLTDFFDEVSLLEFFLKIDSSTPDLRSHRENISTPKHHRATIPVMSLHLRS